jgi:hypothetical protein
MVAPTGFRSRWNRMGAPSAENVLGKRVLYEPVCCAIATTRLCYSQFAPGDDDFSPSLSGKNAGCRTVGSERRCLPGEELLVFRPNI